MPPSRRAKSPARTPSKSSTAALKREIEPLLEEALQQCDGADVAGFVGAYLLSHAKPGKRAAKAAAGSASDEARAYVASGALDVARQRTGWLLIFLFGLLLCARVMHRFEALLASEIELAFFVPLLIGHGGNSGGQCVSTVIRALGSGAAKLSDAPSIIRKEATSGLIGGLCCVCFLGPYLRYGMGISSKVSAIVAITLPCLGTLANSLGSSLPFLITWLGKDPAVIVGPLMTTSVDSCGLMLYLLIATLYLQFMVGDDTPECSSFNPSCWFS